MKSKGRILRLVLMITCLAALLGWAQPAAAGTNAQEKTFALYFFWGNGCPHCAHAKPFLEDLKTRYPGLEVRAYEVWYLQENQAIFTDMAKAYGFEPQGVPTFFLGDQHWVGFTETIQAELEQAVQTCADGGCKDAGKGIIAGIQPLEPAAQPAAQPVAGAAGRAIRLPLLGEVDLSTQSLLVSTLLISFVDGFNPCSLWVLSMLLALTLHTGSRKKVLLIGLVFLTVTAAVYALFITGLFTVLTVVNFMGWIQVVVALVALFFAVVNIKDYFWYKEGLSFTIADSEKPGIYARMRRIMDASQSFGGLMGATVVMAAGVSLVEFSCTAGFPVVWTNLLSAQKVTALTFVLLLLVYMLVYQLDELVIFFSAVLTLRASRLEEKQGRILKLIGGLLMLTLAVVMLVNPALMNNLSSSLIIFGAAFGAALLVLLVHRVVLPAFGIWIGSEAQPGSKPRR